MQSNLLVLDDDKTEVVHFTLRHKKSIKHLKSLFISRAQAPPVNIPIKFVKRHILVCTELVKYDLL